MDSLGIQALSNSSLVLGVSHFGSIEAVCIDGTLLPLCAGQQMSSRPPLFRSSIEDLLSDCGLPTQFILPIDLYGNGEVLYTLEKRRANNPFRAQGRLVVVYMRGAIWAVIAMDRIAYGSRQSLLCPA